jgi:hypothetical protein
LLGLAPGKDVPNGGAQALNVAGGGLGEAALDIAEERLALPGALGELLKGDPVGSAKAAECVALALGGSPGEATGGGRWLSRAGMCSPGACGHSL